MSKVLYPQIYSLLVRFSSRDIIVCLALKAEPIDTFLNPILL